MLRSADRFDRSASIRAGNGEWADKYGTPVPACSIVRLKSPASDANATCWSNVGRARSLERNSSTPFNSENKRVRGDCKRNRILASDLALQSGKNLAN